MCVNPHIVAAAAGFQRNKNNSLRIFWRVSPSFLDLTGKGAKTRARNRTGNEYPERYVMPLIEERESEGEDSQDRRVH